MFDSVMEGWQNGTERRLSSAPGVGVTVNQIKAKQNVSEGCPISFTSFQFPPTTKRRDAMTQNENAVSEASLVWRAGRQNLK